MRRAADTSVMRSPSVARAPRALGISCAERVEHIEGVTAAASLERGCWELTRSRRPPLTLPPSAFVVVFASPRLCASPGLRALPASDSRTQGTPAPSHARIYDFRVRYVEYPASPSLRPYVKCHWVLEDPGASAGDPAEPVVPDGSMELVVHYGAPYLRQAAGGRRGTPARAALAGQITAPLWLRPTGPTGVIGVRFHPHGAGFFVRDRLADLRDSVVDAAALWGAAARHLPEQIGEAQGDGARIAVLESFLHGQLRPPRDASLWMAATGHLVASDGQSSVDALLAATGAGRRRLERGFARTVGLAPKQLARILRFQAVFERMGAAPRARWSEVALDCGYYDQAHLIRDFRALTGMTPAAWFAGAHALADPFTGRP